MLNLCFESSFLKIHCILSKKLTVQTQNELGGKMSWEGLFIRARSNRTRG